MAKMQMMTSNTIEILTPSYEKWIDYLGFFD